MDKSYEQTYLHAEESNWWCVQRRAAVLDLLTSMDVPRTARILEVGSAGGALVELLQSRGFAHVEGCDLSPDAVAAGKRRGVTLFVADAGKLKVKKKYDVLIASDVLEHIQDERKALAAWKDALVPGGKLIVFVPAFNRLWSKHDDVNRHFRRYTVPRLSAVAKKAGFDVVRAGYWNFLLFFPALFQRTFLKSKQVSAFEGKGLANAVFEKLLAAENAVMKSGIDFPVGVSCFAVLKKPVSKNMA